MPRLLNKKVANAVFGVATMLLVLSVYWLQDLTGNQILPNTPLIFITVTFLIWWKSNVETAIVSYLVYLIYYTFHFLVWHYHYTTDPLIVTSLIIVLPHIIGYCYLQKEIECNRMKKELKKYEHITAIVESKVETL